MCVYVCKRHMLLSSATSPYQYIHFKKRKKLKLFQLMLLSVGIIHFKIYRCSGNSFNDKRICHKIYKSRNYSHISPYV